MAKITAASTIAYAHYTLYEALPRLAKRGFQRIEIGSFCNYCYHFNNGSPRVPELKRMLKDLGLQPVALNWSSAAGHAHDHKSIEVWLDAYRRKMDEALEVGIEKMTMHFGPYNERADRREQLKVATGVYRRLAEHAQLMGMKMLLEMPHLQLIHHDVDSVLELFGDLDLPNVGLLIDSSHWGVIGYDLEDFLRKLGERLWHIHLRDSSPVLDAERDRKFMRPQLLASNRYNLTLTPGVGTVDFTNLAKTLDRMDYSGEVTTEFEYFDMTLDEIEKQYDQGLSFLRDCGWELPEGVKC